MLTGAPSAAAPDADDLDGGAVTTDAPTDAGGSNSSDDRPAATTAGADDTDGFPIWIIVAAAIALLLVCIGGMWHQRRKRASKHSELDRFGQPLSRRGVSAVHNPTYDAVGKSVDGVGTVHSPTYAAVGPSVDSAAGIGQYVPTGNGNNRGVGTVHNAPYGAYDWTGAATDAPGAIGNASEGANDMPIGETEVTHAVVEKGRAGRKGPTPSSMRASVSTAYAVPLSVVYDEAPRATAADDGNGGDKAAYAMPLSQVAAAEGAYDMPLAGGDGRLYSEIQGSAADFENEMEC